MIRSTILYRRIWYIRRRNAKSLRACVHAALVVVLLAVAAYFADKNLMPNFADASEFMIRNAVNEAIYGSIKEIFSENAGYEGLMELNKDENGRIDFVRVNPIGLNRLAAGISEKVRVKLSKLGKVKISVPVGAIFGNSIFAGMGPRVYVKMLPVGSIETDYRSEFSSAGINQTRYTINLTVKTRIGIVAPLLRKQTEIETVIPLAETVIVGNVPSVYRDR